MRLLRCIVIHSVLLIVAGGCRFGQREGWIMMRMIPGLIGAACIAMYSAIEPVLAAAPAPVVVTVNTRSPGPVVPADFAGLSFGPAALRMHAFDSTNTQAITLFHNLGVKYFRMGGTWVDHNAANYMPSRRDIDALFRFIKAAGLKDVIYTLRLENGRASQDAATARYIWRHDRRYIYCFAIGNEPNLYRGGDPQIKNFKTYLAKWRRFADAITTAIPGVKIGGPDTTGTIAWAPDFIHAERHFHTLGCILIHWYVGGSHKHKSGRQMLDGMLSPQWDAVKYPMFYRRIGRVAINNGLPYRFTEANCYAGGNIRGVNNSFATALFALDFMHWWAAHGCAGVSVHTGLSNLNGAIYRGKHGNWHVFPWGYAIRAFDAGGFGQVDRVTVVNHSSVNLAVYAVTGRRHDLLVTIIHKSDGRDARAAHVTIAAPDFSAANAAVMFLLAPHNNLRATTGITLGGAAITNHALWHGHWVPLAPAAQGRYVITLPAASAGIVKLIR